jgi:hypothetical protein
MEAAFVLIPSPFLGPGSWAGVASHLPGTIVADYSAALDRGADIYGAIAQTIAAQTPARDCVLVGHSGGGALIPLVAEAIGPCAKYAIFADALLPHPGRSWFDTVSPELAQRLQRSAKDGRLPRWDRWWPDAVLETLLPDAALRKTFAAALPQVPLQFLEGALPPSHASLRCAYQQWSSAYDGETASARVSGWLVERLALDHLALVTRPAIVADHLENLAARLAAVPPG